MRAIITKMNYKQIEYIDDVWKLKLKFQYDFETDTLTRKFLDKPSFSVHLYQ